MGVGSESHELERDTFNEIEKDALGLRSSDSNSASLRVEKGMEVIEEKSESEEENYEMSHEHPFPIDPDAEVETQQLTFRAVFVGCCLGGVIAASKYVHWKSWFWQWLTISIACTSV